VLLACGSPTQAGAQDSTATGAQDSTATGAQDSTATGAQDSTATATATPRRVVSTLRRTGEELDRVELGAGVVRGFFDAVGSFGYRRSLSVGRTFEHSIMGELTGTAKDQLTEGAFSVYLLLRPVKSFREEWRIRPLIEAGPAFHTVVQVATLEGLNKTRYKAHAYVKTHAYAGIELIATRRVGLLVRGRMSVPSHRPFDYAQAAIFLR
jgi:hypothetical protein